MLCLICYYNRFNKTDMLPADIENYRTEINSVIKEFAAEVRIFIYYEFYDTLLTTEDELLIEGYISEFIEDYISSIQTAHNLILKPEQLNNLLKQQNQLLRIEMLFPVKDKIKSVAEILSQRINWMNEILAGKVLPVKQSTLQYPLIGNFTFQNKQQTLLEIEPISIRIKESKNEKKIVFLPWAKNYDKLNSQAKICFDIAIQYLKKNYRRFSKYHEIIIYFENQNAAYEGTSFSVALTIGFIEALTKLYNLPYSIKINQGIVTTGQVNQSGEILSVGNSIGLKTEAVFFSPAQIFVIPKADEQLAQNKLNELKEIYPERKLKIIPSENVDELLDRRNLIDIKKISPFVRVGKAVKRNPVIVLIFLSLFILFGILFYHDYDDNPFQYEVKQNSILIENKYGKLLWNIKGHFDLYYLQSYDARVKILDVNNDGKNEVLFSSNQLQDYPNKIDRTNKLILLSHKGKIIWYRTFTKNLESKREKLTPPFGIDFGDTIRINKDLHILCFSNNGDSYPSAIYLLNLTKNFVASDTLWNHGFVYDLKICDLNEDNEKEVMIHALNNGLEKAEIVHMNLSELKGQIPSNDDYRLFNIPTANLLHYFTFSNTDFNKYLNLRNANLRARDLHIDQINKIIKFQLFQSSISKGLFENCFTVEWDYKHNDFKLFVSSEFRINRDSLVAHGILSPPYTDTKDYKEIFYNGIEMWDGKKFINFAKALKKSYQK